tara:strand:+ start:11616 stop:12365 length:750 start_codon:yes stop_codon:yes gene_type:complete
MSWRLENVEQAWINDANRRAKLKYACAEFIWYLSGTRDGWIKHYAPQYKRFLEPDGSAHGAYGSRWMEHGQMGFVLGELKSDSRRAVMTCWDAHHDIPQVVREGPDVPCTLSLQFLREDDRLNMVVTMRSNDAWLGLPYDMFCFATLQRLFAGALGLRTGWYTHQVGSMHLYERNVARAEECLQHRASGIGYQEPLSGMIPDSPTALLDEMAAVVMIEMKYRMFGDGLKHAVLPANSLLRNVVAHTIGN